MSRIGPYILVTFWFFRHGILEKSALVFLYFRQVWMRKIDKEIPTWKNRISNIVNKKISDVDAGFSRQNPYEKMFDYSNIFYFVVEV
ncbi:hypothetical protein RIR_jg22585.t1 [Rhizophagus irregularis DAOM 181602=DAOM 197198]|nr:hypothetical protein RIR_jg22585.t1 [Rhizophagus irregularis DAOM 181602=DAOM 197198]